MARRGKLVESRIVGDVIEKKCTVCNEFKAPHDYHKSATGWLGTMSKCKECCKEYYQENREHIINRTKEYEQKNREYVTQRHKEWKYRIKFDLTKEEYSELAKNGCMICGTFENLCVDHDHNTNEVRGILCRSCNGAIGLLQDSVDILLKAAAYLESKQGSIPGIRPSAKSERMETE